MTTSMVRLSRQRVWLSQGWLSLQRVWYGCLDTQSRCHKDVCHDNEYCTVV